jgi:peroxiredoxin
MKDKSDFHLLTVVTNRGETEDKVRPFMEKHGLSFQALIDYKKVAWRRYKLTGWPETFLIDRDGKILEKYVGPREWDSPEFINKFNKLIEGP